MLVPDSEPGRDEDHRHPADQQGEEDPEEDVDRQATASSSVVEWPFVVSSNTRADAGRT